MQIRRAIRMPRKSKAVAHAGASAPARCRPKSWTSPSSCSKPAMPRPRSCQSKFSTLPERCGNGCTARNSSRAFAFAPLRSTAVRVTAICSLGLTPEFSVDDIEHTDIVILPASGWDVMDRIASGTKLLPWLRKMHARGAYIAGICTGVGFLAEAGLLDGHEATTHWGVADIMRQRYPKVRWRTEQFVTEDEHLFCSGGVYASIDLSLYLVEKFCGHEVALQVAKSLLLSMPRQRQSGYSVVPLSPPHSDEKIRRVEAYLQQHLNGDVLDRHAGRTRRDGPAQLHPSFQECDRTFAGCLYSDVAHRRPRRKCSNTARCRSRMSARRSATRTSRSSAVCSSVTPA